MNNIINLNKILKEMNTNGNIGVYDISNYNISDNKIMRTILHSVFKKLIGDKSLYRITSVFTSDSSIYTNLDRDFRKPIRFKYRDESNEVRNLDIKFMEGIHINLNKEICKELDKCLNKRFYTLSELEERDEERGYLDHYNKLLSSIVINEWVEKLIEIINIKNENEYTDIKLDISLVISNRIYNIFDIVITKSPYIKINSIDLMGNYLVYNCNIFNHDEENSKLYNIHILTDTILDDDIKDREWALKYKLRDDSFLISLNSVIIFNDECDISNIPNELFGVEFGIFRRFVNHMDEINCGLQFNKIFKLNDKYIQFKITDNSVEFIDNTGDKIESIESNIIDYEIKDICRLFINISYKFIKTEFIEGKFINSVENIDLKLERSNLDRSYSNFYNVNSNILRHSEYADKDLQDYTLIVRGNINNDKCEVFRHIRQKYVSKRNNVWMIDIRTNENRPYERKILSLKNGDYFRDNFIHKILDFNDIDELGNGYREGVLLINNDGDYLLIKNTSYKYNHKDEVYIERIKDFMKIFKK